MQTPIDPQSPAESFHQPGLEYWFKERRTLVDFRRGPLGRYFDGFADFLKAKGYSHHGGSAILGRCCQFNAFLIDQGLTTCEGLSESFIDAFREAYVENLGAGTAAPRASIGAALKRLFAYLAEIRVYEPVKPRPVQKPYSWLLEPYLQYLREDCQLSEITLKRARVQVSAFLESLQQRARRNRFKALRAEALEGLLKLYFKNSQENLASLSGTLRRFFGYCASHHHTAIDFSGLVLTPRRYRHAALPKGLEDSALDRVLATIDKDSPVGARDYAIAVLMMAYGIRGVSAAELLLDDLDWQHSRIRIRAQKGGKEVVLPLLEPVGDALLGYLRHRFTKTPFREVFLSARAPFQPLSGLAISVIVRRHMKQAGVKLPGGGSSTLRHSWAIRALAHDAPIKAIADVLGHRYIDTTFIYAKTDLKALREVAMPWPKKG